RPELGPSRSKTPATRSTARLFESGRIIGGSLLDFPDSNSDLVLEFSVSWSFFSSQDMSVHLLPRPNRQCISRALTCRGRGRDDHSVTAPRTDPYERVDAYGSHLG